MIITSILSMVVANYLDTYSIKHDRLSYTGIRKDFVHPKRGIKYTKNTYPEILNVGLIIAGVFDILGFLRIESVTIRTAGLIFSLVIVIIGAVDVSTHYNIHNWSVLVSQPIFLLLTLLILVKTFDIFTFTILIVIIILAVINILQQRSQNQNPGTKANVLPQKLFIYIEALYLIVLSYIIN